MQHNPLFERAKPLSQEHSKGSWPAYRTFEGEASYFSGSVGSREAWKYFMSVMSRACVRLERRRIIGVLGRESGPQETSRWGNQDLENKLGSQRVIRTSGTKDILRRESRSQDVSWWGNQDLETKRTSKSSKDLEVRHLRVGKLLPEGASASRRESRPRGIMDVLRRKSKP